MALHSRLCDKVRFCLKRKKKKISDASWLLAEDSLVEGVLEDTDCDGMVARMQAGGDVWWWTGEGLRARADKTWGLSGLREERGKGRMAPRILAGPLR